MDLLDGGPRLWSLEDQAPVREVSVIYLLIFIYVYAIICISLPGKVRLMVIRPYLIFDMFFIFINKS